VDVLTVWGFANDVAINVIGAESPNAASARITIAWTTAPLPGLLLQRQKDRVEELTSTLFDWRNTLASLILLRGAKPKVASGALVQLSFCTKLTIVQLCSPLIIGKLLRNVLGRLH
jgi:hypothetical protein